MDPFILRTFDESKLLKVEVLDDSDVCIKFDRLGIENAAGFDGYAATDAEDTDFVLAVNKIDREGVKYPDWKREKIFRFGGKILREKGVLKVKLLDWMFIRRFTIVCEGETYSKWYKPGWRDSIIPPDSMMPWGSDFYKYLEFLAKSRAK